MANKILPYGRQNITPLDLKAVEEVLLSESLTTGPYVTKFEEMLCSLTGAKHAIACSNATAGLHLACLALNLPDNFLGVTSPITFVASSNCFEFTGGRSDFIDIDPGTRCMSVVALEHYCKTVEVPAVVVPVSFTGTTAPLPEIYALAIKYGFKVIEDAAHSIGSTYQHNGTWYHSGSCNHSDLSVFSFHPVKTVTTGEGGAVLTNDDTLAERLRLFRAHGIARGTKHTPVDEGAWYYEMIDLGYNYRITDIQCGLGISHLNRLQEIKARRLEIVQQYASGLKGLAGITVPKWSANQSPCFHLAVVELPAHSLLRKKVFEGLRSKNIFTQVHYIPVYWQPYYQKKYGFKKGKCPAAEHYYEGCLSLPLYIGLSDQEIQYVLTSLKDELRKYAK